MRHVEKYAHHYIDSTYSEHRLSVLNDLRIEFAECSRLPADIRPQTHTGVVFRTKSRTNSKIHRYPRIYGRPFQTSAADWS